MGCPCQQKGSQRFTAQAQTTPQTSRQNLAYDPAEVPVRRAGSVFWDGKTQRVAS